MSSAVKSRPHLHGCGNSGLRRKPGRIPIRLRKVSNRRRKDSHIEAGAGEQLSAAVRALTEAVRTLPEDERKYLSLVLRDDPPPPREQARIMGRPVQDIYTLKQRA